MAKVDRVGRIADVDDGRAVRLHMAGQWIEGLAAVVADVGDPSLALPVDRRLIGAAALETIVPGQDHVQRFGRRRIRGGLRRRGRRAHEHGRDTRGQSRNCTHSI